MDDTGQASRSAAAKVSQIYPDSPIVISAHESVVHIVGGRRQFLMPQSENDITALETSGYQQQSEIESL